MHPRTEQLGNRALKHHDDSFLTKYLIQKYYYLVTKNMCTYTCLIYFALMCKFYFIFFLCFTFAQKYLADGMSYYVANC